MTWLTPDVSEIVSDWLEDNGYGGLTDGTCRCEVGNCLRCGSAGLVGTVCHAAYRFRCTDCSHLTECDRTDGRDVFSDDADWCREFSRR